MSKAEIWPIICNNFETVRDRIKLVLITNRKSHMRFRLVPKSVTLYDLERRNDRYLAFFSLNLVAEGGRLRQNG